METVPGREDQASLESGKKLERQENSLELWRSSGRTRSSHCKGPVSVPGWGTKMPQGTAKKTKKLEGQGTEKKSMGHGVRRRADWSESSLGKL